MKTIFQLLAALLLSWAAVASASTPLPARFEWQRVFVDIPLKQGGTISCFTDSGGGGLIISQSVPKRLGLDTTPVTDEATLEAVGPGAVTMAMPAFDGNSGVPQVDGPVIAIEKSPPLMGLAAEDWCFLGSPWFAGHVWTWDYPAHRLALEDANWKSAKKAKPLAVGFKTDPESKQELAFPRITVEIAGEATSMLLDTGASTFLTPSTLDELADNGPPSRATSMIVASRFAALRAAHPNWRVIENAQRKTLSPMIEVPDVRVAGIQVGPVWFTERTDREFHDFMSQLMDAQVEGAIGGNAFRDLVMTVDYPGHQAWFSKSAASARH